MTRVSDLSMVLGSDLGKESGTVSDKGLYPSTESRRCDTLGTIFR
jgi:hypothetical protein